MSLGKHWVRIWTQFGPISRASKRVASPPWVSGHESHPPALIWAWKGLKWLRVAEGIPHFWSHSQAFFSLLGCEAFTVPITDAHETCGFTWLLQMELYLHLLNGKWKFVMRTFGKWAWEITRRKTSSENSSNLQSMNVLSQKLWGLKVFNTFNSTNIQHLVCADTASVLQWSTFQFL